MRYNFTRLFNLCRFLPASSGFFLDFLFCSEFHHLFCECFFTVRTFQEVALRAAPFCCKPVIATGWAWLIDGFIIRNEIAFGIAGAAIECALAFAAFSLDDVADRAFRAFDSGRNLACVLACRVTRAADEFSEAARSEQKLTFMAFGTCLA